MRPATLVRRGLFFHARAHLATLFGVALASAVLVGALAVGDSVEASLARAVELRLGGVRATVGDGERWFRAALAAELVGRVPGLVALPVAELPATVANADGSARADDARLFGVPSGFFAAFAPARRGPELAQDGAWVGGELARRLGLAVGDEFVLKTERPSAMSRELALASSEESVRPLRLRVAGVLADEEFGALATSGGGVPAANVFVAEAWLVERLGVAGRANRLYLGGELGASQALERALAASFALEDVGLRWVAQANGAELRSDQVFFSAAQEAALTRSGAPLQTLIGYFVNALASGERATPYSTVAAVGGAGLGGALDALPVLAPSEIALNAWTARDLGLEPGATLTLRYNVLGSGRRIEERASDFRVAAVIPTEGAGADPSLMPDFPGIGDAEDCRDWDPGFPIDRAAIRDVDEEYWDLHRGSPKAFVSFARAEELWGNRFGTWTAVRVAPDAKEAVEQALRALAPGELGLPLRVLERGVAATSDFAGLFLGLSFFLIGSALLLVGLFFAFSLERRARELGVLRASGFLAGEAGRLFLGEAAGLALAGACLGSGLGVAYTRALVALLERGWAGALGRTALHFHVEPSSLVLGGALAFLCALGAVLLILRRAARAPLVPLLAGELAPPGSERARTRGWRVAWVGGVLGFGLLAWAVVAGERGLGFGAGMLLFLSGLAAVRRALASASARPRGLLAVGWSNAARRPGRSLVTVALAASGVFLLVVAGASRRGPSAASGPHASGTGGFDFLGRTSLAVYQDLESAAGREFYGLAEDELADVALVPLRVRAGDEASCLNLDRPKSPRLVGLAPERLKGRFRFAATAEPSEDPWTLLTRDLGAEVEPVIVDATSLQWTLHGKLGGELALNDGEGRPFRGRVVATLADSILQGDVLLSERAFERRFPREAGHRGWLVDAPEGRADALRARLTKALGDEGLTLVPTHERLDLLNGVQNTYLAIFQALGGLGLLFGSVGLLALVLRQALERRGELALFRALGFTRGELTRLFLGEQGGLVLVGLALGSATGLAGAAAGADASTWAALGPLAGWVLGTAGLAVVWVLCGARLSLRGANLNELNRE